MPIFIDVVTKLSRTAAMEAARDAERIFGRAGRVIADDFGKATGGLFDDLAFRSERGRRSLDAMQRNLQRTADVEADAARKMERSNRQASIAEARLSEVREKHADTSSRTMNAELALADARARAGRDSRSYIDALNDTETAHKRVDVAARSATESTGFLGGALGGITGTTLAIGGTAVAVAGLGVAIAQSIPAAAQFQAEMMKLHTAADIPTSQLAAISKTVLDLAPQVGLDPSDLMNGAYFVAKSGHRSNTDMSSILKAGAQMAAIEQVPLETALNAITTQISDYNLHASDASVVGSQIVTAAGAGKVPLGEFSGAMHVVEPVASKMGIAAPQWMAMVAQMTQSGMHADNAGQDVLHLLEKIQAPTSQMRAEWGALGLDPTKVKEEFTANPLATLDKLDKALDAHTGADGMVGIDANYKNVQVQQSIAQMLGSMDPAQRQVADQISSGQLTYKQWRRSRGGQDMADVSKLQQFNTLFQQSQGFSQLLASGQGSQQTRQQAIQALIGDQVSGQAFQQLTGASNAKAQATAASIAGSSPDAKGDVEGSAAALDTFQGNAKKAGAAWASMKVSMGTVFLPAATSAMRGLNDALGWIIKHKTGIGEGFEMVGGLFKAAFSFVPTAVHAVDGLWHAIDHLWHDSESMSKAVGHVVGEMMRDFDKVAHAHPFESLLHGIEGLLGDLKAIPGAIGDAVGALGRLGSTAFGGVEHLLHIPGHELGGPIFGDGPDGVDSELRYMAPGEHVWTDGEVSAAGGHGAMYRMRAAARAGRLAGFARGGSLAPGPGQGGITLTDDPDAPHGPAGTRNDPVFIKSDEKSHGHGGNTNKGEDASPGPGGGVNAGRPKGAFGAPLGDDLGLSDGLPGLAKWFVTFLGDMAAAPIEGAMMRGPAGASKFPGGPRGSDTVPAWLTPGEKVVPKGAGHALHLADGTNSVPGVVGESQEPAASGAPLGSTGGSKPGLGISGGPLGAAEGAAAAAANIIPGAGAGVQIASQMMNRTIAYGGQLAGIGVEGLMSTFMPSGNALADFGNTLPGKILSGVAGAKPASPVVAGNTKKPLKGENVRNKTEDAHGGNTTIHMYNPKIHAKDVGDFADKSKQASNLTGVAVGGTQQQVSSRMQ